MFSCFMKERVLKKKSNGMNPIKTSPPNPFNTGMRKSPESLTGFHTYELGIELQLLLWNDFCHHVGCILVYVNLLQLEVFHFYSITNPVISDFNMLCSGVIGGILAQSILYFDYRNIPQTHLISNPVP